MTAVKPSKGGWETFFHFLTENLKNGQKTVKMVKKWPNVKIFDQNFWNFLFSESIQNVSKRILNRKSRFRKKISLWKFFSGTLPFFDQNGHLVKIFDQNFWKKNSFRTDSECFKTYFKPIKSISKKLSRWKALSRTPPFLTKMATKWKFSTKIFETSGTRH